MAAQFDDVPHLNGPRMGLLWDRFRDKFPRIQIHPQRSPSFEVFGKPRESTSGDIVLEFSSHPSPLVWYVSEDESELIQVQKNRFVFNWRCRDKEYPRYGHVRKAFSNHLEVFRSFLAEEKISEELRTNQWEITYVNHIERGDLWRKHSDLGEIIPSWKHRTNGGFLPKPEDVALNIRYRINDEGEDIGRLHIVAQPVFAAPTKEPIIMLRLTARGPCQGGEMTDDLLRYLDIGRKWIVQGFTSITSPQMHENWGRER